MTLPSGYRVRFEYSISYPATTELLATGYTEHCFVDSGGKLVKTPEDVSRQVNS